MFKLGFYNGDIDGLQGQATKEAITNFKTLFGMPETNSKISGAFLTELKRVEHEQEVVDVKSLETELVVLEAEASIQVAETSPAVTFYDTVQAVPSTPVVTDSLPAAEEIAPIIETASTYIAPEITPEPAPEPEALKVASIPSTISEPAPTPAVKDVIIEPKLLKNASAKYPSVAERKKYYVNVAIEVAYDIGADGRPANIRIVSNDHNGKYNSAFEKEAMRAIEKMRFEPRTINGVVVYATDYAKRIVFRAE